MNLAPRGGVSSSALRQLSDGFHRKEQTQRLIGEAHESVAEVEVGAGCVLRVDDHRNRGDGLTGRQAPLERINQQPLTESPAAAGVVNRESADERCRDERVSG